MAPSAELNDIKHPLLPLTSSVLYLLTSLTGALASLALLMTELDHLKNPDQALSCNINPLIGCGSSLLTWQAHLLAGIPNSALGLVVFTICATLSILLLSKTRLPAWVWYAWGAGLSLGAAGIVWFLYQSVTVFKALCPYCMVVWAAIIVLWVHIGARAINLPRTPETTHNPPAWARFVWQQRWLITASVFLLIALTILLTMTEQISRVLS
ncbi:MAG: vitamin K epoxide reductase family protein [Actinomycetaceae bacterium]|nr:vitamin K epoxide reductase family protein [Actinomycetaceae bacterium]